MKKSFYKLARTFHPDRAPDDEKVVACEKFNIIHNAYSILADPIKKQLYDAGSSVLFSKVTIAARWENYLKPVDIKDIEVARNEYRGSCAEQNDLIREFIVGKGSLTHLLNTIPFMRIEDENRIIEVLRDLMEKGNIPKMPIKKLRK